MRLQTSAGPVAEELIQVAAYYHYENRLKYGAEGSELGDWLKAETDITGDFTRQSSAASAAASGSDELTVIKGVGRVLADRLSKAGHTSLERIAAWTCEDIEELDAALKLRGRIQRDGWVAQAKALLSQ